MKKINASDYILDTSKEYSIYVAENRAIPKVTDGLKDGQRKALWLMRNNATEMKTVGLVGNMSSSYLYVHGDSSAGDTIGKLAAPYLNNVPLIEGLGAFGTKVDPYAIGAPRYTEIKRSKAAMDFLYNDLDLVPTKPNYDGSTQEPVTFLPLIPVVLMNGISGIAVGWSTSILPRDPKDLQKAVIDTLDGKKLKSIEPKYTYVDVKTKHLEANSWEFIGAFKRTDTNIVTITELPPELSLEKFKDRLDQLEENGKIQSYDDNSAKNIEIIVKMKRGDLVNLTDEKLIDLFKLKSRKTERIVVVDWNYKSIREYANAEDLVVDFVNWRFSVYIERYNRYLADAQHELNFYQGVKACFDQKLPEALLGAKNKAEVVSLVEAITTKFTMTDEQIDSIASFASYRWAKDNYQIIVDKIKNIKANIAEYTDLLANPDKIKAIYKDEVKALKF